MGCLGQVYLDGPLVRFRGKKDNFKEYEIQIEWTSYKTSDRTKNILRDAGKDLIFLRDTLSITLFSSGLCLDYPIQMSHVMAYAEFHTKDKVKSLMI